MKKSNKAEQKPEEKPEFIRGLMQDKSEEEIAEAMENFNNYLSLVERICLRLEQQEDAKVE